MGNDMYVFLAQLHGGIAVGVGHLGLLAQVASNTAVNEAQNGDGAECDGNDGTGK